MKTLPGSRHEFLTVDSLNRKSQDPTALAAPSRPTGSIWPDGKSATKRASDKAPGSTALLLFPNYLFLILEPEILSVIRVVEKRHFIGHVIHDVGNGVKNTISVRDLLHILDEADGNSPLANCERNAHMNHFKCAVGVNRIRRAPFPQEFLGEAFAGSVPNRRG